MPGTLQQIRRLTGFRVFRWGLPVMLLLAGGYAYIAYAMASGITTLDRSTLDGHPAEYGLPYKDVAFSPRGDMWDDIVLRGWIVEKDTRKGAHDELTIILVHGLNSNRTGDNALALTSRLLELDFNVLLFDLRGHGESDGDRLSAGYFEKWDVLGAYDFLVQRGVPPGSIGILGWSMGGATTLLAVSEEPAIRAVVADSAFANVRDLITQETVRSTVFPKWLAPVFIPGMNAMIGVLYGIDIGAVVPERAAATLGYPILIIHGEADSRIPVGQSIRIHASAPEGSELWLIPGSDHADAFLNAPDEYVQRIAGYFRVRLAGNKLSPDAVP